jgi:hypothetical protein
MSKLLTWQKFCIGLIINIVAVTLLVILGNLVFTPLEEIQCWQQCRIFQNAVRVYNQSHPNNKTLQMEFGFPGFIEQTLIPQDYIKDSIKDIREKHSYYLERNAFVNCRIHQRNPASITILGIAILSILATVIEFAVLGYQIKFQET